MSSVSSRRPEVMPDAGAARIIPELEIGAKCRLKYDCSTGTLIRRYKKSKELLQGR
jgi:hypothetical protein